MPRQLRLFLSLEIERAKIRGPAHNVAGLWESTCPPDVRRRRATLRRAYDEVSEVFQTAVGSPDEAKRQIASNSSLPEDVRGAALSQFEMLLPHPEWSFLRSWGIARESALSKEGGHLTH